MPSSPYHRTKPEFGHVINAEIKESNLHYFRLLNPDYQDIIAILDTGRDPITEYRKNFVGTFANKFDRHNYLTQTEVERLINEEIPKASTVHRNPNSRFIGIKQQQLIHTLKVTNITQYKVEPHWQSDDGSRQTIQMIDEYGNEVIYRGFAQAMEDVEIGHTYRIKCKVKTHTELGGVKLTQIERPSVMFETDYVEKPQPEMRKDMTIQRPKRKIPYRPASHFVA